MHVKEECQCTSSNERCNWAYSDHEEKCHVSELDVLSNWPMENSINYNRILVIGNEELMVVHIINSHVKASNIPSQFSTKNEALANEDEWSKQNPLGSLSGQHNVVGTCRKKFSTINYF